MARLDLAHGCAFLAFETPTMTNWHDECAKCPVCKTKRDDGDPVIRCEKAGEVRVCLTCGAGYKIFQGSRRTEQETL